MKQDRQKKETAFAQQYMKFKRCNLKPSEAFRLIKEMGYHGTKRTMDRHVASVCRTGHALSTVKKDCSHSSLNAKQMSIVNDWILAQNSKNCPIGYVDMQRFIYDTFNIKVCRRTPGNIAHRLGHTIKTCQTKNGGFKRTNAELKILYMGFISKMKKENRFLKAPADIRSIDVTYTKRPTTDVTTLSPVGSGPQRADVSKHDHTNAIVTMISGDGLNHTPCLMFTHDPRMAPVQKNTPRGKRLRAELEAALKLYGITEDRIIYQKSEKHYFAESPEVYEHFLKHYPIPKNVLILHDGGNAFKRGGTSILEDLGFKDHATYPSDVHQFLSPNDNKLHGCKATWHEEYYEFREGVSASLRLMNLIDLDTVQNSKKYFQNNLFRVRRSDLDDIIGV